MTGRKIAAKNMTVKDGKVKPKPPAKMSVSRKIAQRKSKKVRVTRKVP